MSHDEELGKVISILKAENKRYEYPIGFIPIEEGRAIILKGKVEGERIQFYFGYAEDALTEIGPVLDCSFMSDEACLEGWFTGAMAGICCQDLTGFGKAADFDWFEMKTYDNDSGRKLWEQ